MAPSAPALIVLAVSSAVLLLALVASSGPVRVWSEPPSGSRGDASSPRSTVAIGSPEALPEQAEPASFAAEDAWWMRAVALLVGLLLLRWAWIVLTGWWQLFRQWQRRERRLGPPVAGDPSTGGADGPPVTFDLEARLSALRRGSPRNAIVACWCELEDEVAAAGLPRSDAETTAEYTERVLLTASVDAAAVIELAEIYREARFSMHHLDDGARERAVSALRRAHAALGGQTRETVR